MQIVDFILNTNAYFQDFITRSTYHSNAIEGNTLSFAETYAILWNDNSFTVSAQPRELFEVTNHKYALRYVLDSIQRGETLSEALIKKIGVTINKNIREIDGYRRVPVYINGAEHLPPAPAQIPQQMMYFVHNYNNTEYGSVFEKAAQNHIAFERIHPFEDGNGRTGRLLINFELLRCNMPPVIIPKDSRTVYFDLLAKGDSAGLAALFEALSNAEAERIRQFTAE